MRGSGYGGVDAQKEGEGGGFGSGGEERGDGRRCTFVDVRGPDLEWGQRDFEAEADQDEREAELQERAGGVDGGHAGENGCAGDTVDQGDAVEEKGGGERAEEEVFHGGFAGFEGVTAISGQDVAGGGAHFEADEGGEQRLRGGKYAHAGGGEEDEGVELGGLQVLALEVGIGGENDQEGDEADEEMEEDAEAVHLDEAEEGWATGIAGEHRGGGAQASTENGYKGEHLAVAGEGLQQHEQRAEAAPDGFGKDADQVV